MPWKTLKRDCKQKSSGKSGTHVVVKKKKDGKTEQESCHTSDKKAKSAVRARYANKNESKGDPVQIDRSELRHIINSALTETHLTRANLRSLIKQTIMDHGQLTEDLPAQLSKGFIETPAGLDNAAWRKVVSKADEQIAEKLPGLDSTVSKTVSNSLDVGYFIALLAVGDRAGASKYAIDAGVDFAGAKAFKGALSGLGTGGAVMIGLAAMVPIIAYKEMDKLYDPYKKIRELHKNPAVGKNTKYGGKIVIGKNGVDFPSSATSISEKGIMQNPIYGIMQDSIVNGIEKTQELVNDGVIDKTTFDWIAKRRRRALDIPGIIQKTKTVAVALKKGVAQDKIEKINSSINGAFKVIDDKTPSGSISSANKDRIFAIIDKLAKAADSAGVDRKKVRQIVNQKVDSAGWGSGTGNKNKGMGGYFWHRKDIAKDSTSRQYWAILAKKYKNTLS